MYARLPGMTLAIGSVLVWTGVLLAQDTTPPPDADRPPPIHEVLFSIDEPPPPPADAPTAPPVDATADPDHPRPPFTPGDLLSERGYVVATNVHLLRNFHPMPSTEPIGYGLDAVQEVRFRRDDRIHHGYLFSINRGFFDEVLGERVGPGDVLSDSGRVVMTNAQLLHNFHPATPPTTDEETPDETSDPSTLPPPIGLDAIAVVPFDSPLDENHLPEFWFSTNVGFFDAEREIRISDGDLLSTTGRIVARNGWLLRNFHPAPPPPSDDTTDAETEIDRPLHFGLDAVFVPRFNARLHASDAPERLPEIWFSIRRPFYDTVLKRWITGGDLLSTSGRIVRTNAQLLRRFATDGPIPEPPPPPSDADVTQDPPTPIDPTLPPPPPNVGLDAVHVRPVRCDYNLDGAVDVADFARFQVCFNGEGQPVADACADVDADGDGDVDGLDFADFQVSFTGPFEPEPMD